MEEDVCHGSSDNKASRMAKRSADRRSHVDRDNAWHTHGALPSRPHRPLRTTCPAELHRDGSARVIRTRRARGQRPNRVAGLDAAFLWDARRRSAYGRTPRSGGLASVPARGPSTRAYLGRRCKGCVPMRKGRQMERDPLIQRFVHELEGPTWIAKRVEVLPGVVDSEIVQVTPAMDRLYGYVWPDTLVGQHMSTIHIFDEAQIMRQYAVLRHWVFEAPQHYVIRGLHPNGRSFRVIKHVTQHTIDTLTVWVTHHERWGRSAAYPYVMPLPLPPLPPEALHAFTGDISVAHVQHVGPLLRETSSLERLRARLRVIGMAALPAAAPVAPELPHTAGAALATLPTLGQHLRDARYAQGLSQQALAQRCTILLGRRVSPQHLSNLEQGHRLPSLPLLQVLATVLALAPGTLVAAASRLTPRPETPTGSAPRWAFQDVLARVQDAAQEVTYAQQTYREALGAARQAGYSFRQLAAVSGCSPSRIRQLVAPAP
jgi:transcriptional regulator with XRE-family HTH domain